MSDVKIKLGATPADGEIVIDGHSLDGISGFQLTADVHRGQRLLLEVHAAETTRLDASHVTVHVDSSVLRLLERAGWTPPPGEGSLLDRDENGCPCEWKDTGWPEKPERILGHIVPTCPVHGAKARKN